MTTEHKTEKPRAVVCMSGGMDSCVCATVAARDYEIYALHFSYGQRTEARELLAASTMAELLGAKKFLNIKLDLFRKIGGSALTDLSIAVPDAAEDEDAIGTEVPVTYVPFRNTHFIAGAVSWAEVIGAETICIGAVEQDSSGYPDCRPAYYEAFNELIRLGRKTGTIRVVTPLIHMRKSEIVEVGVEVQAPFHVSWSCYSDGNEACGICESCVLRLRAFRQAGLVDPIVYAAPKRD